MALSEDFLNELNSFDKNKAEEKERLIELNENVKRLREEISVLRRFKADLSDSSKKSMLDLYNLNVDVYNSLNELSIPKEVKGVVEHKHKVLFSDATKVVLIVFFIFSTAFVGGGVWFWNEGKKYNQEAKKTLQDNWTNQEANWLWSYYQNFSKKHPNDTKYFISKKGEFPEVNRD